MLPAEARSQGSRHWELLASLSLAGLLQREGDSAQACAVAGPSFNALKANGDAPDLLACRALLERLGAAA
jgi:hypothetical protein